MLVENPIDIRRNITQLAVSFKDTLNRSFQKTYQMNEARDAEVYLRVYFTDFIVCVYSAEVSVGFAKLAVLFHRADYL
jgi:NADH:ubiquinone oxidoreductase subunit K